MKGLLVAAPLLLAAALPATAAPNLVTNGDFENSSALNTVSYPTSAGGIGQVGSVVSLPGWTKTITKDLNSGGFAFVTNTDADFNNSNPYPDQGGGFPSIFSPTAQTNIFLWGPDFSPNKQENNFSASPNGGNFLAVYGDYGRSKMSQTVSGLAVGTSYSFSFEYAGSQATDEFGETEQYWAVTGPGGSFNTPTRTNPSRSFSPWLTYSTTFVAASDSVDLDFEPFSSSTSGTGSLAAVLLLDNVQIRETTAPPAAAPAPLPVLGAGAALCWSQRLRRRLNGRRG